MKRAHLLIVTALVTVFLASGCGVKTEPGVDRFSARMIVTQGMTTAGMTGRLNMTVTRWTTAEEREKLFQALQTGGEAALKRELENADVGSFYPQGSTRWKLNYAVSAQTPQGRRIRLVTARAIRFGEFRQVRESSQYEYGLIEFFLDEKGQGEGKVLPLVKVRINQQGGLEIESLGTSPIKLMNIKKD